jgi:2-polyprenyl-6-hydroxyphenyl methylase/3-demethylubiquinone-9 3-methyltransferase
MVSDSHHQSQRHPVEKNSYYTGKLAADHLKKVYDLAPEPVRRYLTAEIEHVRARLPADGWVLELGCGYGRVLKALAPHVGHLVGIDTSRASLRLARDYLADFPDVLLVQMDALHLTFPPSTFDLVCCLQNGISAFQVDQRALLADAVVAARPGGHVLFSSYADIFWEHRLEWFRLQAAHGLIGEIDEAATGEGAIVCKDGFQATTVSPDRFQILAQGLGRHVTTEIIADSSVFCEIWV